MPEFHSTRREGRVLVVTIERPEVMNALHPPANRELEAAFEAFASDPELWAAVLTGAGDRAFSAGNDLKYQAAGGRIEMPPTGFAGLTHRFDLDKPVIAAVNGLAMGGGFEIALACDLIVAVEHAVFALPEPRVGLLAGAGGLHRLPRQIGLKQAMGLILTGRRVSAAEGERLGFVNEVVHGSDPVPAALAWAEQILECAPLSVRASKEQVQRGLEEASLEAALARRYPGTARLFGSEDFVEGPRAFAEKRPPRWTGR